MRQNMRERGDLFFAADLGPDVEKIAFPGAAEADGSFAGQEAMRHGAAQLVAASQSCAGIGTLLQNCIVRVGALTEIQ